VQRRNAFRTVGGGDRRTRLKCVVTRACACARIWVGLMRVCAHITTCEPVFSIRFHSYGPIILIIWYSRYYVYNVILFMHYIIIIIIVVVQYIIIVSLSSSCRVSCLRSRFSGVGAKTHVLPGNPRPSPTATHRSPAGPRMRVNAPFEGWELLCRSLRDRRIRYRRQSAFKRWYLAMCVCVCVCVCICYTTLYNSVFIITFVYNITRLIIYVTMRWCSL